MNDSFKIIGAGEFKNMSSILISTFIWKIKNFSAVLNDIKIGKKIESPIFSIRRNIELKFKIRMYPKGEKGSKGHVDLYLMTYNHTAIELKYKFSFLDNENKENYEFQDEAIFNKNDYGWGKSEIVQISELLNKKNKLIPDDILTISCELKIDMTSACNKEPSDVKIIVDDWEFHAHKNILAANSTVFAAMFQHNMEENQQNLITIKNTEKDAFNAMLQFIYLKESVPDEFSMIDILTIAEKFAIKDLKSECENRLCKELTVDNVLNHLKFAHIRNLKKLKGKSMKFIKLQGRQIIRKKKFNSVAHLPKNLIVELFSALLR